MFLTLLVQPTFADTPESDLLRMFPEAVGGFKRITLPTPAQNLTLDGLLNPGSDDSLPELAGQAEYASGSNKFFVEIFRYRHDGEAYSLLSRLASSRRQSETELELTSGYGTVGFASLTNEIAFFKGVNFVRITSFTKKSSNVSQVAFAKALAETLEKGEADVPPLVKHLPDPETSQKKAVFLARFIDLQPLSLNQPVLSALETNRDADAALVDTNAGKVLLVEYNTPQLAKDNDDRLIARIHELWNLGQPAPTAYRRVGNYSVFVFDSPNEAAAKQLIDQVKYEQVVQWLGENPNILKEAEKRYVETTLGVFVAVVKASGFAFIGCLGLGGLFGALLFTRRRAQQKTTEAFSDAGGMLRLNIDELTPQTDPARLLGPGN